MLQHNGSSAGHGSLVESKIPNSFDLTPSITPASEGSTAPVNFFANTTNEEEPPLSVPFGGFPRAKSEDSNHVGSSKLLNSISRNTSSGNTSIWGDGQSIPSLESTLQSSFFGSDNQKHASDEKNSSWSVPGSNLPSGNGSASIW